VISIVSVLLFHKMPDIAVYRKFLQDLENEYEGLLRVLQSRAVENSYMKYVKGRDINDEGAYGYPPAFMASEEKPLKRHRDLFSMIYEVHSEDTHAQREYLERYFTTLLDIIPVDSEISTKIDAVESAMKRIGTRSKRNWEAVAIERYVRLFKLLMKRAETILDA